MELIKEELQTQTKRVEQGENFRQHSRASRQNSRGVRKIKPQLRHFPLRRVKKKQTAITILLLKREKKN